MRSTEKSMEHMTAKVLGKDDLRRFGLVTGFMVAVVFGLLLPWIAQFHYPVWPWGAGLFLAGWALTSPLSLRYLYTPWMRFAEILGVINSHIILAVAFYFLFFPISIVLRLTGHDPMRRKFYKEAGTYRLLSKHRDRDHLRRPY